MCIMKKEIYMSASSEEIVPPTKKERAEAFRKRMAGTGKNKQSSRRNSDELQKGRRHR